MGWRKGRGRVGGVLPVPAAGVAVLQTQVGGRGVEEGVGKGHLVLPVPAAEVGVLQTQVGCRGVEEGAGQDPGVPPAPAAGVGVLQTQAGCRGVEEGAGAGSGGAAGAECCSCSMGGSGDSAGYVAEGLGGWAVTRLRAAASSSTVEAGRGEWSTCCRGTDSSLKGWWSWCCPRSSALAGWDGVSDRSGFKGSWSEGVGATGCGCSSAA